MEILLGDYQKSSIYLQYYHLQRSNRRQIANKQNSQSTITRTNSPNFSHGNPSRHISEKKYLSPAIGSSRSNRYQITNKHISQSTITIRNSPNFSHGNPSNVESTSVACVTPTDNVNPGKKFKCPVQQLTSSILKGTKRNLGSDLQFPSIQEITENSQLVREMEIPTRFTSLSNYKQVFTAALKEHLNIILFDLGVKYHYALSKIDTTSYLPTVPGTENKGTVNSNPVCKCGAPSKMIQVKKSGPNHNRFFYACNAARNSQCKVKKVIASSRCLFSTLSSDVFIIKKNLLRNEWGNLHLIWS
ncbi:unnamed protein product [Mytilus edulis]|uniref:GRF-type domain-containing protein n=1 Tax=Mytilus edulis TaxID=6550 RepID=A0A8S3QGB8_MYTED|nr:unnamed protein product [Mytilus edulis]